MGKYYMGLDVSTQGTKLLLLDYETKRPAFVTSVNYDRDLPAYNTRNGVIQGLGAGVSESDPAMWVEAVHRVLQQTRDAGFDLARVAAVSVSGQQHGLVCLDAAGNLTRKTSKLWNDVSTQPECEEITRLAGGKPAVIREVGNSLKPGYTASKILQFKKSDPQAFAATTTFFLVHNFVNWFLTGGKQGGVRDMEPGDTSGMALWNPATKSWSRAVCNAIASDLIAKLTEVRPAMECIGRISAELCQKYGFSPECRVDAGSGDNMYGAAGTGNVRPGTVTISLGTSGTAFTVLTEPYVDPEGEIASFCDSLGNYLPLLCVSNLANGYNALQRKFGFDHKAFEEILLKTRPGNNGRIVLPWFEGERTPDLPQAAPIFFGFTPDDFTCEALCRGIVEGHVMNLYEGFLRLPVKAQSIRLTGGLSRSKGWRQTIADIFGCEVVPVAGEGAALGAAIHAAYVDNRQNVRALAAFVDSFVELNEAERARPDPANAATYETLRKAYLALSRRVRGAGDANDPFALRARL